MNHPLSFPLATQCLENAIRSGVAPGFVLGVSIPKGRTGQFDSSILAFGHRRTHPESLPKLPMTTDTVFDLASVSKVMGVGTLVALLVDRGWVDWGDLAERFFPEYFRGTGIRLAHLLSHTSGLPAWNAFWKEILVDQGVTTVAQLAAIDVSTRQQAMRRCLERVRPEVAPGERCLYSDLGHLWLGFIVEQVMTMPLDRAMKHGLFNPWQLSSAHYRRTDSTPENDLRETIAATEICPWRGSVLQGQVHDDNCWAMGGYAGHAGIFSNAADLLRFGQRWLTDGISPSTRSRAWTRVSLPTGCERTPGWDTPSSDGAGSTAGIYSPRTVGHLGFTGTTFWIDSMRGWVVTLLSNRVHPTRANEAIKIFRPEFHRAFAQDMSKILAK